MAVAPGRSGINRLAVCGPLAARSRIARSAGAWPRVDVSDQGKNRELSDFWLHDASFLRIRNINLNYNFPNDLASTIGMRNLGMYVSVQNLYTFTKFGGPEVDTQEDPLTGIPQPRVWSIGLKAGF